MLLGKDSRLRVTEEKPPDVTRRGSDRHRRRLAARILMATAMLTGFAFAGAVAVGWRLGEGSPHLRASGR